MKTKIITGVLLLMFFGNLQAVKAQLNQQIKLGVNQELKISKSDLTIKFISVLDDSRCPVDTNCVWAGNAQVQIKIKKSKGEWKTYELNLNLEPKTITFNGYEIKLVDLAPKLRTNVRINRNGYTATFAVSRQKK